jgi:hypothetical protein
MILAAGGASIVNPLQLGYVVQEITRNRLEEAAQHRLALAARAEQDDPPVGPLRRNLARAAASLSRIAAEAALRLDECTAESRLGRSRATGA